MKIEGHMTSSKLWKMRVALENPRLAWAYLNRRRTIGRLTKTPTATVNAYYDEIRRPAEFVAQIESNLAKYGQLPLGFAGSAPELYTIARIVRPSLVVETGVANGISSAFILEAMRKNDKGKLISVTLPGGLDPLIPSGTDVGWVVPGTLRDRWSLQLGASSQLLPEIVRQQGPVDIFFHDSDHSYENMLMEFETVWPCVKPGGYLLADDVWQNNALSDFCKKNLVKASYLRNTGIAQRP
jgi:predicted O-methyltransferase YrrM